MNNTHRTLAGLGLAFLIALSGFAGSVPTPTPTPEPSVKFSNGSTYTVSQVEQAVGQLQGRLTQLQQQRDSLAGQVVDLNATIAALQKQVQELQARVAPAEPKK